ncbi:N-alpha-acetyltransferase 30 [Entomophthora muscae]|uniref:N-alpha-acetyltransferase 30 n=1 Tax=Entomophthora muscae TaxID=34485 RepID=A0ACC2UCU1_9FUNG|nr:N-alpha-acetyltransferase 30 [Entomophthora muscae]
MNSNSQNLMNLIGNDLSEPYSIFTYRYFLTYWPELSFLAKDCTGKIIGAVVSKLDQHRGGPRLRGYIAMLAVDKSYRHRGIGSSLAKRSILAMKQGGADEVVLETERTNVDALALYARLGFVRAKRLHRYYLTGVDAFRLKLWL